MLDHDVDAGVGRLLRRVGHDCVTAGQVGLATANDDDVSVFADDHQAILITHDREAINRRRRNTFGRHVFLDCSDMDAVEVVGCHLEEIVHLITTRDAIVLRVSRDRVDAYRNRWQ